MHPYLIDIPLPFSDEPFHLRSFGVLVALGFIFGSWILGLLAQRYGDNPKDDPDRYASVTMWILMGLFLGGRLMYVAVEVAKYLSEGRAGMIGEQFIKDPLSIFYVWQGGLVMYGGLTGCIIGGLLRSRQLGLRPKLALDLGLTAGCFGQAVGRIGCFLVGDDYGQKVPEHLQSLPFPIIYEVPKPLPPGSLFGVHNMGETLWATQLWMTINATLLGLFALWMLSRQRWTGQVTACLLILYPIGRYFVEEFRGDSVRGLWFNGFMSTSQLISLTAFPFGLFLLWRGSKRHKAELAAA